MFSGNGLLAFSSGRDGNWEVYSEAGDGSGQTNLTNNPAADLQPSWSPDGTKIGFASKRDGNYEIYVMNADGSSPMRLTVNTWNDLQPAWSPDGTKVAFVSYRDGNAEIYEMNPDGSGQTNLSKSAGPDSDPAWSPDGSQIAFTSGRDGNSEVYVMDAGTGASQTDLTNAPGSDADPAWSPDGTKIAFASDRTGNSEIFLMDPDGANPVDLSNTPGASESTPAFAPDHGAQIAFTSDRDGNQEVYLLRTSDGGAQANITHNGAADTAPAWQPLPPSQPSGSPIQHVVMLYMENHAFDDVLGKLCYDSGRCDGAITGKVNTGQTISLARAQDITPVVQHNSQAQTRAVHDGLMDGFSLNIGCTQGDNYGCYVYHDQDQIPNLWDLASTYAISDRTFELDFVPSWQAHLELVTPDLNGFSPNKMPFIVGDRGPGWGCDSLRDTKWQATVFDSFSDVPSCVPQQDGTGPYKPTSVAWEPTIMDRIEEAGRSWHLYAPAAGDGLAYGWAVCPSFADCIYTPEAQHWTAPTDFIADAQAGNLSNLSVIIPYATESQHNKYSMSEGDNWIASVVGAAMAGPDWSSTAIFITYDDCGCFYDHVPPPPGLGIRVPMVIVSQWAKPSYTDSTVASYASMLAFIEHTFGLAPIAPTDAQSYDYSGSFDFAQRPLQPIRLRQHPISAAEARWIAGHPPGPSDPFYDPLT